MVDAVAAAIAAVAVTKNKFQHDTKDLHNSQKTLSKLIYLHESVFITQSEPKKKSSKQKHNLIIL